MRMNIDCNRKRQSDTGRQRERDRQAKRETIAGIGSPIREGKRLKRRRNDGEKMNSDKVFFKNTNEVSE